MGIDFSFETVIETGPVYLELTVHCHYWPASIHAGSETEVLFFEASDEDMEAIPGLWPAMKAWITSEFTPRFEKEAAEQATKLGLEKYDEHPARRITAGFSKAAGGYR